MLLARWTVNAGHPGCYVLALSLATAGISIVHILGQVNFFFLDGANETFGVAVLPGLAHLGHADEHIGLLERLSMGCGRVRSYFWTIPYLTVWATWDMIRALMRGQRPSHRPPGEPGVVSAKTPRQSSQLNLFNLSPETMTVAQVTRYVKSLLDGDVVLQDLWVEGELSNFKAASSGHAYFTMKDDQTSLRCVMWRSDVERQELLPQDGQSVLAHGRISVYEVGGVYQFYVDHLQPAGMGRLYLEFEALKRRLAQEGLFDAARKRPLPPLPRRVGVVTSPVAAALRDILNVLARRYPLAQVVLSPPQIVAAIQALNDYADVDVILVARGGGSLEELWAFNDERVARAIVASRAPVVSGVGHEVDFTIADFAADVRAPTPSAAAELVAPDRAELQAVVRGQQLRLAGALQRKLVEHQQSLHYLVQALRRNAPLGRIQSLRQRVDELSQAGGLRLKHLLALRRARLDGLTGRLATLSPFATLERGYAIVRHGDTGRVVTSVRQVAAGEPLAVRVRDGEFDATAAETQSKEEAGR
jgi:exodeoxyribonuclease VII large subunit